MYRVELLSGHAAVVEVGVDGDLAAQEVLDVLALRVVHARGAGQLLDVLLDRLPDIRPHVRVILEKKRITIYIFCVKMQL